jgi:type VI secretion system protein ImpM
MGVVIPSVDQVGRYFPLTLCRTASASANPLQLFKQHKQWFVDAERLLMSCLYDDFQLDVFENSLQHLSMDESGTVIQPSLQHHNHSAWRVGVNSLEQDNNIYPLLLADILKNFCIGYSIWKTEGSQHIPATTLVSQGFPPFSGAASMLDGQWQNAGWLYAY